MVSKQPRVLIGAEARQCLLAPTLRSIRAVNCSLGPHGRAVVHDTASGGFGVASDGSIIAQEIADIAGPQSLGPRILEEILFDTRRDLGDGTARLACSLGAMLLEGHKQIAAGHSAGRLADEILRVGRLVQDLLVGQACRAPEPAAIANTAINDARVATAVSDALARVGAHGVVDIKEQLQHGITSEFGIGYALDAALVSQLLEPNPPATAVEFDEVFVLVVDDIVSDFGRLTPVLEGFAMRDKALAVVARDVIGAALEGIVRNRNELGLRILVLKPKDVATRAGQVLEDLAVATGATLISIDVGLTLNNTKPSMLGRAKRVRFEGGRAVFSEPAGKRDVIDQRRIRLLAEADKVKNLAYDREHLQRRAGRLAGAWGELGIGGRTTHDTNRRVRDARAAISCLRAAASSGVVAGGGSALVRVASDVRRSAPANSGVERAAYRCVAAGLDAVARQISVNSGLDSDRSLALLRGTESPSWVLDANTGELTDLNTAGIVDPLSITVGVVARAISAAASMLRVDALVSK